MTIDTLSATQTAILDYLTAYIAAHGWAPSMRDIQAGCGLSSTSVVTYNLVALQRAGRIRRAAGCSRAIAVEVGG